MFSCACRNPETCKCQPVLDVGELKDRIRLLRTQKAELQKTAAQLQQDLDSKTQQLKQTRQSRLFHDPDPELRIHGADQGNDEELDDSRFRMANEKLEMQLLMHEIRSSLPALESEVRWRESLAQRDAKSLSKLKTPGSGSSSSATSVPSLWLSPVDLEAQLQQLLDQAVQKQRDKQLFIQTEKERNFQCSQSLAQRRRDLTRLCAERDLLRHQTQELQQLKRLERERRCALRREHIQQRDKLQALAPTHQSNSNNSSGSSGPAPHGFHALVFAEAQQRAADETVSLRAAHAALLPWLYPLSATNTAAFTAEEADSVSFEVVAASLIAVQRDEQRRKEREVFGDDTLAFFEDEEQELLLQQTNDHSNDINAHDDHEGDHSQCLGDTQRTNVNEDGEEEEELLIIPSKPEPQKSESPPPLTASKNISNASPRPGSGARSPGVPAETRDEDVRLDLRTLSLLIDRLCIELDA